MSGKRFEAQIQMNIPPTEESHVVRLADLVAYVEQKFKDPVRVIDLANFDGIYDGGVQTITAATVGALSVDGVALLAGDRVLLAGQAAGLQNGVYAVQEAGDPSTKAILERASDFNTSEKIIPAVHVAVSEGTTQADTTWILTADGPITLDTTPLTFQRSTGPVTRVTEERHSITGDNVKSAFPITHTLNSLDVSAYVYDAANGQEVEVDTARTSASEVTVTFGRPIASSETYRVLLRAETTPV
jgi:hypothetical protein